MPESAVFRVFPKRADPTICSTHTPSAAQGVVHRAALAIAALTALCVASIAPAAEITESLNRAALNSAVLSTGESSLSLAGLEFHRTPNAVSNERVIAVDGSVTLALWDEIDVNGAVQPHYAISLDGQRINTVRAASYDLALHNGTFDPLIEPPPAPVNASRLPADQEHPGVFIVQFHTQPLDAFRKNIEAIGGKIHHYLPNHAYLVALPAGSAEQVAALPYVRWVGPWSAALRLREPIADGRVVIQVFERGLRQKDIVAQRIAELGGLIHVISPAGFWLEATLTEQQLIEIARMDEVHFIERWAPSSDDMDLVRVFGGASFLETQTDGQYLGVGVRGEVMDGNMRATHVDFAARPPVFHGPRSGSTNHGTSTYGILFGDGTGNPIARGMLPLGQGIFADYELLTDRHTHTGQLVTSAYQAVFQSNSWGGNWTTNYTATSALMDDMIFTYDLLITQSQSNRGTQASRPEAWAKNVISVGGINHRDTLDRSDDCWCGGASIGPAADGRIKPDLAYFYDLVFTVGSFSDTDYRDFCCTSAATPCVAGHFGLFFEMWHDGVFGNPTGSTVFESRPHAATARALMINTARPWEFSGATADLARMKQGWGAPNLERLYALRERMLIVDESDLLTSLETRTYVVTVAPLEPELRATLVYRDPAASPGATIHRINDLSLRVTSPGGVVYHGNHGLTAGNWSVPDGAPDERNTVENVFIQNPEAGAWTVEVLAADITTDAYTLTPAVDAAYALVVSGVIVDPCAGFTPGDANCDGAINFDDIESFVVALLSAAQYRDLHPACDRTCTCDLNADGLVDFADIDGFIGCLTVGCP